MKLHVLSGVGTTLNGMMSEGVSSDVVGKVELKSSDSIVNAFQRIRKYEEGTLINPLLLYELVVATETNGDTTKEYDSLPDDIYEATIIRIPEETDTSPQLIATENSTPAIVPRGAALLQPRVTIVVSDFPAYLAAAPTDSTMVSSSTDRMYPREDGTGSGFLIRLAAGTSYELSGKLRIQRVAGDDVIDAATMIYTLNSTSATMQTTVTHITESGVLYTDIYFNCVIPYVETSDTMSIYIASYDTSSSPRTDAIGTIVELWSYGIIRDMNNSLTTKTYGPFYFYNGSTKKTEAIMLVLQPST